MNTDRIAYFLAVVREGSVQAEQQRHQLLHDEKPLSFFGMSPCREDTLVALRNFVKNIPYFSPKHKHQFRKGAIRISYTISR